MVDFPLGSALCVHLQDVIIVHALMCSDIDKVYRYSKYTAVASFFALRVLAWHLCTCVRSCVFPMRACMYTIDNNGTLSISVGECCSGRQFFSHSRYFMLHNCRVTHLRRTIAICV
jgi:hypothetical protein